MKRFFQFLSIGFLLIASLQAADADKPERLEDITIKINFTVPPSEQLEAFKKTIPSTKEKYVNYKEFQDGFVRNTRDLIELVESGKIYKSNWAVTIEPSKEAPKVLN